MVSWIVFLTLLGVALIFVEIFVPGLIIGLCGALALVGAVVLSYMHYGAGTGDLMLAGLLVGGVIFVCWWLGWMPKSAIGRRWTLNAAVGGATEHPDYSALLGATGKCVTPLRPGGVATFGDLRVDVVLESGSAETGETVRVLRTEGAKVVVVQAAAGVLA